MTASVSHQDLDALFREKYTGGRGWGPRMRRRFGYFNPDDHYEALLARLVTTDTVWLDVGCGRGLFPSYPQQARRLATRCRKLVGIDPSPNVHDNPFVHESVQGTLGTYDPGRAFDLITCRMVAEHVEDPGAFAADLARLARPGARLVIYTVHRWSPAALLARLTPFEWHHPLKERIWDCQQRDTFPVCMRLNTRRAIGSAFASAGFREESFRSLPDCRTFGNFRRILWLDLMAWRILGKLYPEKCLIGVYQREG